MHRPQHPQAVLHEGPGIHGAQDLPFQIGLPLPEIDQLAAERVVEHGVDREVAPASRFLEREVGIPGDVEAPMALRHLAVPAWQAHVEAEGWLRATRRGGGRNPVDRERLAHPIHAAESTQHLRQLVGGKPVHFQVELALCGESLLPPQAQGRQLADPSPHQVGSSPGVADGPGQRFDGREQARGFFRFSADDHDGHYRRVD